MTETRQRSFQLETKLLCNPGYQLSKALVRPESSSIRPTLSPKLGDVYPVHPLRVCNIIWSFQPSWGKAVDCSSLCTAASQEIQDPATVSTIRTAIDGAAVWMSGSEGYKRYRNPDASSYSEMHDEDGITGLIRLV